MHGEWVRKPKDGASVVFVHGFLSTGETCWRHENGSYWPELLKNETELDRLGIYVYAYQTEVFSGSYRLGDVVDDLKERMKLDGLFDCEYIIFVCHSMGGIVVRQFLVDRQTDLIDRKIKIGLFLVASPHLGSSYANWLTPVSWMFRNAQALALRFSQHNAWLNDLAKNFRNLKEEDKLRIKGKELIEDKPIKLPIFFRIFLRKQIVEPFSAAGYFKDSYKVPKSDHFSIAKPCDKDAVQHLQLCQFIKDISEVSKGSKKTGDKYIDQVLTKLHALADNATDAERMAALAPLFDRAAFHAPRQTNWDYFLYAVCHTRLLLQSEIANLHSPVIKAGLREAVKCMLALENATEALYGPGFSLPHHIEAFIHSSEKFINKLPPRVKEPDAEFEIDTEKELDKLLKSLHGIMS